MEMLDLIEDIYNIFDESIRNRERDSWLQSQIISLVSEYHGRDSLDVSAPYPVAGFNRLVLGIVGNGDYVVKIAKNLTGINDNFRAVIVSDAAYDNKLVKDHIALANYYTTDKYSSYDEFGSFFIVQEKLKVLNKNPDRFWEDLKRGSRDLWEEYVTLIQDLERYFIIGDVNIVDTPNNFGFDDKGKLKILDLGQLVPIPKGKAPVCPVCGSKMHYYLPDIDENLEYKDWAGITKDGYTKGIDAYECSNHGCKHSSRDEDGYPKNKWVPISASALMSQFFEAYWRK